MPIYEFYCSGCHMIFNFLSREIDTTRRPACPRCGTQRLERKVSLFAISKGRAESASEELPPGIDEGRMEQAMETLARQADGLDEDDPRAMAGVMRKFYESTGLQMGDGMQEALSRIAAGEDPDKIEEQLGDLLEQEGPFGEGATAGSGGLRSRLLAPEVDPTLYEM